MRLRSMCGRGNRSASAGRPDNVAALVASVQMPGIDGVELARRARDGDPDPRILSLSARLHALGVNEPPKPFSHLRKPLRLDDLRKAVARLMQVFRAERGVRCVLGKSLTLAGGIYAYCSFLNMSWKISGPQTEKRA